MLTIKKLPLFLFLLLTIIGNCYSQETSLKPYVIVLDPGHGGKDPGTSMGTAKEKDIVLSVALKAGNYISDKYPDVSVIYTRKTDEFIPLSKRADIANKVKANLFISIHVNYFNSYSVHGAETYILGMHRSKDNLEVAKLENSVILLEDDYQTRYEGFDPNSAESYIMFELIQNEFLEQSRFFADGIQNNIVSQSKRRNRGVKQAGFLVLRKTTMPSILMEIGYLSNYKERTYLTSDIGQDEMARSIANAFDNFKTRFEERTINGIKTEITDVENTTDNFFNDTIQKPQTTLTDKNDQDTIVVSEIKNKKNTPDIVSNDTIQKPQTTSNDKNEHETIVLPEIKNKKGLWFGVQIMTYSNKLSRSSEQLKGQDGIYYLFENKSHKYICNLSKSYDECIKNIPEIRSKFEGAFPVAFIDGKKANLAKAIAKTPQ